MQEELQMAQTKGKVIIGIKDQNDGGYGKNTTFFQKLHDEAN